VDVADFFRQLNLWMLAFHWWGSPCQADCCTIGNKLLDITAGAENLLVVSQGCLGNVNHSRSRELIMNPAIQSFAFVWFEHILLLVCLYHERFDILFILVRGLDVTKHLSLSRSGSLRHANLIANPW